MNSKFEDIEVTLWICAFLLTVASGVSAMHLLSEHAMFMQALASVPANTSVQSGATQTLVHASIFACATTALVLVAKVAAKLRRLRKEDFRSAALPQTA